jgi:methylated-DNA-[protein]-cysteine S-methyltransferase
MDRFSMYYATMASPMGPLCLAGTERGLVRLDFQHGKRPVEPEVTWQEEPEVLSEAVQQLREYFAGTRQEFSVALAPAGTPFQQRVWEELRRIPYGVTITYRELARRLGMPNGARAAGTANGRNPIAIIIPCHRVIGADGRLRGYASGLPIKHRLLQHEGARLV